MRKNKKMYIPYLLTCICMVMMLYIIQYLKHSEVIQNGHGGTTVCMTMGLGGMGHRNFLADFPVLHELISDAAAQQGIRLV